jgi:hypothetical protein
LPDMILLVRKICEYENCKKTALYGFAGESVKFCNVHKEDSMINITSKKCVYEGCNTRAGFGIEGGKPEFCVTHKTDEMVDLRSYKCTIDGCKTQAHFGFEGCKPTACGKHKTSDMIALNERKCKFKGCKTQSHYGFEDGKAEYCYTHKLDGMIQIGGRKCKFEGCIKTPVFGYENGEIEYCGDHKMSLMINLIAKYRECSNCGLKFQTLKSEEKYLCPYCRPAESRKHNKELKIVKYIQNHTKFDIIHDKISADNTTICGKYRPDILIEFSDRYIIVEIDENQHKQYDESCEISRMHQIFEGLGISVVFIRYNPDPYKNGKKRKDPPFEKRMDKLINTIDKYKKKKLDEFQLRIKYLYYDKDENKKNTIVV